MVGVFPETVSSLMTDELTAPSKKLAYEFPVVLKAKPRRVYQGRIDRPGMFQLKYGRDLRDKSGARVRQREHGTRSAGRNFPVRARLASLTACKYSRQPLGAREIIVDL